MIYWFAEIQTLINLKNIFLKTFLKIIKKHLNVKIQTFINELLNQWYLQIFIQF